MIPKIVFRYSQQYDKAIKSLNNETKNYPSEEEIKEYLNEVKAKWENEGEKILTDISKILNLQWTWNKINCYIVGKGKNFAFPLTLTTWSKKTDFVDVLTHELIHRLEYQHTIKRKKWMDYLEKKFPHEKARTKSHLLLFSVHKKIYLSLLTKERLIRNLERNKNMDSYKRAWQIVEKIGEDNLIQKFKEIAK